ncbi:tRNA preQ1(34) S-adenosylmethionine ribosyltransferase-isomerase QueA [Acidobacteria bacterium AH-259-D05]|nr:tRNA preQ1(34) S-adenosylmethionine ribosyltransferase-isomerase QueA [Acidobacteria bacterium AH-259-D05]
MRISDFNYQLPPGLIAQYPSENRDGSRLMVVDRNSQSLEHHQFRDLPRFLSPKDLVVLNNTRVISARLNAWREGRQEKIEVLLLGCLEGDVWEALIKPGRKARPGVCLIFQAGQFEATVVDDSPTAVRRLHFRYSGEFWNWIEKLGKTPLPPYIGRQPVRDDHQRYQTVFAKVDGSVAAPTAGLHFTRELMNQISCCEITLHVGYGTFKPVSVENVEEHEMDAEYYEIGQETTLQIKDQLKEEGRVVTVGTTATRTLEHVFARHQEIVPDCGWTDLFIYPGFKFRVTGALITNFHLPRSTLLLLVSAFAGKDLIEKCYREAIQQKYRFYSYGDAMLIL